MAYDTRADKRIASVEQVTLQAIKGANCIRRTVVLLSMRTLLRGQRITQCAVPQLFCEETISRLL